MVGDPQKPKLGAAKAPSARDAARGEALRANLRKRKAQARGRSTPIEAKTAPRRGDA